MKELTMIDFTLSEEQEMLSSAMQRFAQERVRKLFREAEEDGQLADSVVRGGWDLGLLPTMIPEAHGGFGEYSALTAVVAVEQLGWGDLASALAILAPNLVAIPVLLAGTEAQQSGILPDFVQESPPAVTAALIEPTIQFDPRALQTTAVRDGDVVVLNGTKTMVPMADSAELFLVYANENGRTQAFLVSSEADGLKIGERNQLMGLGALPLFRVTFENCRIPAGSRLGGEAGSDFDLLINHSRVALGALAVGVARAGFEYARDYAKQRVQFGEPVAHRQSIAFMLADMAMDVDGARLMVWEAAWLLDQKEDATKACTVMKQFVDDMVLRVADAAVQTLGGYGYIREYPVELWLRNARGFATFDGLAIV
jgi:alkylation response protein AidB-like acyl-CoA dehydrogenase